MATTCSPPTLHEHDPICVHIISTRVFAYSILAEKHTYTHTIKAGFHTLPVHFLAVTRTHTYIIIIMAVAVYQCHAVKTILSNDSTTPHDIAEELATFRDGGGCLRDVLLTYFYMAHDSEHHTLACNPTDFINIVLNTYGNQYSVWEEPYRISGYRMAHDISVMFSTDRPPYLMANKTGTINSIIMVIYGFTDEKFPNVGMDSLAYLLTCIHDPGNEACFSSMVFDRAMLRASIMCNHAHTNGTLDTLDIQAFYIIAARTNHTYIQGIKGRVRCHTEYMEAYTRFTSIATLTLSHALRAPYNTVPQVAESWISRTIRWLLRAPAPVVVRNVKPIISVVDIITRLPIGTLRDAGVQELAATHGIRIIITPSSESLLQYMILSDFKVGAVDEQFVEVAYSHTMEWGDRMMPEHLQERVQFIKRYMDTDSRERLTLHFPSVMHPVRALLLDD